MRSFTAFVAIIAFILLSVLCPTGAEHFADVIPSIGETQEMAVLSRLVYKFKFQQNFTCNNFPEHREEATKDVECHWYYHDDYLGTQVLLLSNDAKKFVTVVYAGTDDLKTSLEDVNILTKPSKKGNTSKEHLTAR